jgi:hypothetical protein
MRRHYFLSSLVIFAAGFALSAIMDVRRLASGSLGAISNAAVPEAAAQFSRQPSIIRNWEYRVVTKGNLRNDKGEIDEELNRLGRLGFEVCGVAGNAADGGVIIVLSRPV